MNKGCSNKREGREDGQKSNRKMRQQRGKNKKSRKEPRERLNQGTALPKTWGVTKKRGNGKTGN